MIKQCLIDVQIPVSYFFIILTVARYLKSQHILKMGRFDWINKNIVKVNIRGLFAKIIQDPLCWQI